MACTIAGCKEGWAERSNEWIAEGDGLRGLVRVLSAGCVLDFADEAALYKVELEVRFKHRANGGDKNNEAEGAEGVVEG